MNKAYLEIGGLFEDNWTGIGNVIAALATRALRDDRIDWSFCYETIELPRERLQRMLDQRSGLGGLALLSSRVWQAEPIPVDVAQTAAGVFPNIKPMRRYFGKEASVVYDLSPLLTPEFHSGVNIGHFANHISGDIATDRKSVV